MSRSYKAYGVWVALLTAALMVVPPMIAPLATANQDALLFLSGAVLAFCLVDLAMEPVYVRSARVLAGRSWALRLYAIAAMALAVTV